MSKLAQRRRALRLWRWRARQAHLTIPRGEWRGWPSDAREVAGHHPDFPTLRGWVFTAWQYQPWKPNPPWWWLDHCASAYGVKPGDWVLRRPADVGVYAVLTHELFTEWQSYCPKTRREALR